MNINELKNKIKEFEQKAEQISHESEGANTVERLQSVEISNNTQKVDVNEEKEKTVNEAIRNRNIVNVFFMVKVLCYWNNDYNIKFSE